jgi:predicted O-methyltransferase YrrM
MDNSIFENVDQYINKLLAPQDEVLAQTIQSLQTNNMKDMSISAGQGKLLQVFAMACNAKRILELGTLGGYSTIWLARMLPPEGKLITIEFDERHAAVARKNIAYAGLSAKTEVRLGKALEILPQLMEEKQAPFDLIFIDADKPPYMEYFQYAVKLSRPGSIIICDNVIRNGKVLDENSSDEKIKGVQRLNTYLSQCKEVTATILQTVGVKEYDGMVVAVVNQP